MAVNRFSRTVQPYIVNPIGIETFSRIPMAKAAAKTAGIQAANTLGIDYNVDAKDAGAVEALVKPIEEGKDQIVDRIMSEGVSDDLVTNFAELKKKHTEVKDKVNLAEQNKARIDAWNQNLLKLHANNPTYIDFIKHKEYGRGWGGTFSRDAEGNTVANTFDKTLGPRSFSIPDDFMQSLKGISPTLVREIQGGGQFVTEELPDGTKRLAFVNRQGKRIYSNEDKVMARVEALLDEYKDETTERGAYAKYRELDQQDIVNTANQIAQSVISTDVRGGGESRQILSGGKGSGSDDLVDPNREKDTMGNIKTNMAAGKLEKEFAKIDAKKERTKANRALLAIKSAFQNMQMAPAGGVPGVGRMVAKENPSLLEEDPVRELGEELEALAPVSDIQAAVAEGNQLIEDYAEDAARNAIAGERMGLSPSGSANDLYKRVRDIQYTNSDDPAKQYRKGKRAVTNYVENNSEYVTSIDLVTTRSNPLIAYTDSDYSVEKYIQGKAGVLDYNRPGVKVMSMDDKRVLGKADEDEFKSLQQAYRNFGKNVKDGYVMYYRGNATANPDAYSTAQDHHGSPVPKGVAFGDVVVVYEVKDYEEQGTGKTYIVGPTQGKMDAEYLKYEGIIRDIGAIGPGEVRNGTYSGKHMEVERLDKETPAVSMVNNKPQMMMAKPGQVLMYVDGQEFPVAFNENVIEYLDIHDGEPTSTPEWDAYQVKLQRMANL